MKIAISGTIGSGKSTISEYLRTKGYEVFDCDKVNRYLLTKGQKGYIKIIKAFGKNILNDDNIDHQKLSTIVFNNKDKLKILNDIMHPLIKEELIAYMNDREHIIAEVPLLFETDFYKLFDYKLLVITDYEIALDRLSKKGLSKENAIKRINNQMSVEEKIIRSDYIINNNADLVSLYREVDKCIRMIEDVR